MRCAGPPRQPVAAKSGLGAVRGTITAIYGRCKATAAPRRWPMINQRDGTCDRFACALLARARVSRYSRASVGVFAEVGAAVGDYELAAGPLLSIALLAEMGGAQREQRLSSAESRPVAGGDR